MGLRAGRMAPRGGQLVFEVGHRPEPDGAPPEHPPGRDDRHRYVRGLRRQRSASGGQGAMSMIIALERSISEAATRGAEIVSFPEAWREGRAKPQQQ